MGAESQEDIQDRRGEGDEARGNDGAASFLISSSDAYAAAGTHSAIVSPHAIRPAPQANHFMRPRVLASASEESNPTVAASGPGLRHHFAIRNYEELQRRRSELGATEYIIENLFPSRQVGILVGDSGLEKSPLLYQLGVCVAAGIPFLGHRVQKGSVLYLDYENGLGDSEEIVGRLTGYLGLDSVPSDFLMWHYNDCSPHYGGDGQTVLDMVKLVRPILTIIDPLSGLRPEMEEKNSYATGTYQDSRKMIRDFGTTILGAHHIKKPSTKPSEAPGPLEEGDARHWFLQTRGARALINGSDVRLGVDTPGLSLGIRNTRVEQRERIALVTILHSSPPHSAWRMERQLREIKILI